MNIFLHKHQKLLAELQKENVDFILIGGYAVIYYGYKRTTGDMDIWLKPDNSNKSNLIKVLKKFKFNKKDIAYIETLDFSKPIAFHFWKEPERVDCLTAINGVKYNDAEKKKVIFTIDGLNIPIIHYNHLIISKITSERLKDKADVEELQKMNKRKN
jgi:hypothetical protein